MAGSFRSVTGPVDPDPVSGSITRSAAPVRPIGGLMAPSALGAGRRGFIGDRAESGFMGGAVSAPTPDPAAALAAAVAAKAGNVLPAPRVSPLVPAPSIVPSIAPTNPIGGVLTPAPAVSNVDPATAIRLRQFSDGLNPAF